MLQAVKVLPQDFQEKFNIKEHVLDNPSGISRIQELGGATLPAIAVNGEIVFQGEIPDSEELIAALASRLE